MRRRTAKALLLLGGIHGVVSTWFNIRIACFFDNWVIVRLTFARHQIVLSSDLESMAADRRLAALQVPRTPPLLPRIFAQTSQTCVEFTMHI